MTAAELAAALNGKRSGAGWMVKCVAHDDKTPSLSLDDFPGSPNPKVCCHAGCSQDDVIAELRSRGLWEESAPPPTTEWRIRDRAGTCHAIHLRTDGPDGKRVWWTRPDGSKGLDGRRTSTLPLYLAENLDSYDRSQPLYVTEGEKAADAAVRLGLQAVATVTGASGCPDAEVLAELRGFKVVCWPDHDEPGQEHMAKVSGHLRAIGVEVVGTVDTRILWDCEPPPDHGKDAADLGALPEGELPMGDACDAPPEARIGASGIAPVSVRDLLAMSMPPRRWLLEGLIQERDLGMIHAYRGIGKSRFAHGIAVAVASGGSFLRFRSPESRGVLVVDGELPREELQKMLAQAVAASDTEPAAPLNVLSADLYGEPLPSLATEGGQEIVERYLDNVALLILDNISTLFAGSGPENDSESWERAQCWLLGLRRRGIAVELIHHDGKGGAQRGTSRREDVLSQVVQLKRPPNYAPAQGAVFEVHFTKSRGLVGPAADPFEATLQTNADGIPTWTWRPVEDATAARASELKALGLSQRDIAKELGVNQSTVSRALRRAPATDASMHALGDASAHHGRGDA